MSSVWAQLYYKGKDKEGNPIKIKPIPEDVADLAEAVKDKRRVALNHCDAADLVVYPPKTSGDENKYKSGKNLEEVIDELKNTTPPTSDDHPLIVVAPVPKADDQRKHQVQEGANVANKKTLTILDHARFRGCSNMTKEDLLVLSDQAPVSALSPHVEPGKHLPYVERCLEMQDLTKVLETLITTTRDDKNSKLVCEYATISGAGKTRFVFKAFESFKSTSDPNLEVHVVHINFNASDSGFDCNAVEQEWVTPEEAACRLLFSRGLLGSSPSLGWLRIGAPTSVFEDNMLPNLSHVCEAIFDKKFGAGKAGLLIVHLDELSMLIDARIDLDSSRRNRIKRKKVEHWIKNFLCAFSALTEQTKRRFVIPIITHTNPTGRIMGPKKLSQARHEQLRLYPFTHEQSWELLDGARQHPDPDPKLDRLDAPPCKPLESFSDHQKTQWTPCIALAGGHPSLLLDCFKPMYQSPDPGFQTTTVGTIVTNLQSHHRVRKLPRNVTRTMASEFVYDALTSTLVSESKHAKILDAGFAWYLPTDEDGDGEDDDDNEENQEAKTGDGDGDEEHAGGLGIVSAPFPYMLILMDRARGMHGAVARNINALDADYRPTKAMEYVAALAVSHHVLGAVDHLVENRKVGTAKAIKAIADSRRAFICVWPSSIEQATDFGGKVIERNQETEGKEPVAYIGQVKMQEPGANSKQGTSEVMDLAWFIGRAVRSRELDSSVRAFFVSSRQAPSHENMEGLCHAFRVAMTGRLTQDQAKKAAAAKFGKKIATVNITDVINLFKTYRVLDHLEFQYIGRSIDDSGFVTEMKDCLPTGVFSGWH